VIILVPIDSSYTTFYRLSIVTFALERTIQPLRYRRQTNNRRSQHCSRSTIVSTVG